jgi:putative ABC transport system permease protein
VLIGAIVLFSVGNTMSMAIVERTTEIGTLRAIGLRRVGVRTLFVAEALMLGCIGAVLGVLISLAIAWGVNQAGLTWLPPGRVEPVALNLRVWGEPWLIFGTALALIKVATVSAWWPARRAAKMNIVDALRHV